MARFKRGLKRKRVSFKLKRKRRSTKAFDRRVRKAVKKTAEKKYYDASASGVAIPLGGTIVQVIEPTQGVNYNNRIGDEIMRMSWNFKSLLTFGDAYNAVRMIFFLWRANSGISVPLVSDVLQSTIGSELMVTPLNRTNLENKILIPMADRVILMNDSDRPLAKADFSFYGKRLPYKRVNYIQSGGLPTSNNASRLYFLFLGDSIAAPHVTMNYYYRVTYVDY